MKNKKLVAFILIIIIITAICGCAAVKPVDDTGAITSANYGRFSETFYTTNISVITDTQTGNQYLVYRSASGTGLTVLETKE